MVSVSKNPQISFIENPKLKIILKKERYAWLLNFLSVKVFKDTVVDRIRLYHVTRTITNGSAVHWWKFWSRDIDVSIILSIISN